MNGKLLVLKKPIKFTIFGRIIPMILFCLVLFTFKAFAQPCKFNQTGQIRAIISEKESKKPIKKVSTADADFYFTYSSFENGTSAEKWIALPDDRDWNPLSSQKVSICGDLKDNKLTKVGVVPLTGLSKEYIANPPATAGVYKIVAATLNIQPQSANGNPAKESSVLSVTPEAVRNNFFNLPNSVNNFFIEASAGKLSFAGIHHPQIDVVPVTIQAVISDNCQDQIVNQFTLIVRQKLLEQNIDTTNGSVDMGVIIFNNVNGCPPYPFATRGLLGQRGVPNWLWIPESWFDTGPVIITHEIGHALGGNHPLKMQCTDFDNPQTCTYTDAADRDIMTSAGRFNMMPNNYERRRWGWHPPGVFDNASSGIVQMFDLYSPSFPFIKEGKRQGSYFFRSLSGANSGWQIYPEARRNWGLFDSYQLADEPFRLGITLRIGHSNYGDPSVVSILVDANNTPDIEDAPLRQNGQFTISGFTIKCTREHNPMWGTRMKIE
jgi:hypothetical protein